MATVDESLDSHQFDQLQAHILGKNTRYTSSARSPRRLIHGKSPPSIDPVRCSSRALHAITKLKPASSAPDMGTLLQLSPSQGRDGFMRATTFNGFEHDFQDGDTQVMPSQVYKRYKTFVRSQEPNTPSEEASTIREDLGDADTAVTPARVPEINLVDNWKSPTQDTSGSQIPVVDVESQGDPADNDVSQRLLSSMRREGALKTPGLAGFKHDRQGNIITPSTVSKTPGSAIAGMFGNRTGKAMTATQMFENTQGVSSPIADAMRSDPVDSRPSPAFAHLQPTSPLEHAISSPPQRQVAPSSSAQPGPRDYYKPADESQKEREALARANVPAAASTKVAFDFDDSQDDTIISHRRQPLTTTAPNPPSYRLGRSQLTRTRSEVLPAPPRIRNSSPQPASETGTEHVPIDMTDDRSEADGDDELSVDEFDELAQTVRHSQRSSNQESAEGIHEAASEDVEMEVAGSPSLTSPQDLVQRSESRRRTHSDTGALTERSRLDQGFAVDVVNGTQANSQPPRLVDPSSLSSFVPASQIPALSSITRARIRADFKETEYSSQPKPPLTSQVDDNDAAMSNIPSSPPVLAIETEDQEDADAVVHGGHDPKQSGHQTETVPSDQGKMEIVLDIPSEDRGTQSEQVSKEGSTRTGFETAATHISHSPSDPQSLTRARNLSVESPMKAGPTKSLADIANVEVSQVSTGDMDISIAMDVLADKDEDFVNAMKTPTKAKKTAIYGRKAPVPRLREQQMTPKAANRRKAPEQIAVSLGPAQSPGSPAKKRRKVRHVGSKDLEPAAREQVAAIAGVEDPVAGDGESAISAIAPSKAQKPKKAQKGLRPTNMPKRTPNGIPSETESAEAGNVLAEDDIAAPAEVDSEAQGPVEGLTSAVDTTASMVSAVRLRRVLAMFRGSVSGYYTATCVTVIGRGPSRKLAVCFDDDSKTVLDDQHVCAFDLRPDDIVKVDLVGMRTNTYRVVAFDQDTQSVEKTDASLPDANGHLTVRVAKHRKDDQQKSTQERREQKAYTVPVSSIYVTQTMWTKFSDRTYSHPDEHDSNGRPCTPSVKHSEPGTPRSRSRRQTLNSGHLPDLKVPIATSLRATGVFTNCAFAISASSTLPSSTRDHLAHRIAAHGGLVLEKGLHELFSLDAAGDDETDSATTPLTLKPEYVHFGFVALIADAHSRTQKYIQALALSLPTLHYKWLEDSITSSKLLPWERYLLPAGESTFLYGAMRSRTLKPYAPAEARLADVLERRQKMLGGSSVLLLDDGRGKTKAKGKKAGQDRGEVYSFLSRALGAEKVALVDSIEAVKARVPAGGYGWVHCAVEDISDVVAALRGGEPSTGVGKGGKAAGRKRKRSSLVPIDEVNDDQDGLSIPVGDGVRVVGDEFVIQSLILGALVEG